MRTSSPEVRPAADKVVSSAGSVLAAVWPLTINWNESGGVPMCFAMVIVSSKHVIFGEASIVEELSFGNDVVCPWARSVGGMTWSSRFPREGSWRGCGDVWGCAAVDGELVATIGCSGERLYS